MSNTYGQRIRRARQTEGLTQAALADKIGVTQAAIAHWEANDPPAPVSKHEKLEEILGPLSKRKAAKASSSEDGASPTEDEISSFGAWVRENRISSSMSVSELAKKAGLSAVGIYNIESGKIKNPQDSTRAKISKVLGPIPPEVISETEEEQEIQGLGSLRDFDPLDKTQWPKCQGVYVLYDVSQRPIYVGKGDKSPFALKPMNKSFGSKAQ